MVGPSVKVYASLVDMNVANCDDADADASVNTDLTLLIDAPLLSTEVFSGIRFVRVEFKLA
jgi:hypothetical protein